MSDDNNKYKKLGDGLNKLMESVFELGWEALIIADPTYEPKGVIVGPREFIDDFKKLHSELEALEKEVTKLVNNLPEDSQNLLESSKSITKITNDNSDDDGGGKTWH